MSDHRDATQATARQSNSEARLRVDAGPAVGFVLVLPQGETVLGRGSPPPWNLAGDSYLSTQHARVTLSSEGTMIVEDLGSRNGTMLNGLRIVGPQQFWPGDSVTLGGSTLEALSPDTIGQAGQTTAGIDPPPLSFVPPAFVSPASAVGAGPQQPLAPSVGESSEGSSSPISGKHLGHAKHRSKGASRHDEATLSGIAQNVQYRSEMYGRRSTQVLNFRLNVHDSSGHLDRSFIVEMRGASISGQLSSDDEVQVSGSWRDGVLIARTATNLSNGATLRGKQMRRYAIVYGILALLLVATPISYLIHSIIGTVSKPSGLPPNTSLSSFEANLKGQLAYVGPAGFSTGGITQAICNPPQRWASGQEFICYGYDVDQNVVGEAKLVVEPTQPGKRYNYNVDWFPTNPFTCNASSATPPPERSGPKAVGVAIGSQYAGDWEPNGSLDFCAYLYNEDPGTHFAVSCAITLVNRTGTVVAAANFDNVGYEYVPSGTEVPYTFIFAPSQVRAYNADISYLNVGENCHWHGS
jgi:hypothetical protein